MTKRDVRKVRARAVAKLSGRRPKKPGANARLVNELETHRVERDLQNEELRAARAAAEQAFARYTEVFDFGPIGYAVLGSGRQIREVNHAGARLLGDERARLAGVKLASYVAGSGLASLDALLTKAGTSGSVQAEIDFESRNTVWPARVTVAALPGSEPMWLVAFEDITESRRKELELARSEYALREANQRKDEFIAMLSHELRNPLAPIQFALETLRLSEPGSKAANRLLDVIERSTKQMSRLVDDLLDLRNVSTGKIQRQYVPVEFVELVSRTLADYRPTFEQQNLRLESKLPTEELWTVGDPVRLVQILTNLLVNAKKFTPAGGCVMVTMERSDRRAVVRVRDTGIGVEPSDIPRLFEPFEQAAQGFDRSRGGLGLGLAMARSLVELHHGHIEMRSEGPGRGTEVIFELPAESPKALNRPDATVATTGPRRILVIEDHADAAASLQLLLTMHGHNVEIAGDGEVGLVLARTFDPEIVLCDLGLPTMDGFAVARTMRADPVLQDRYLVAVSGSARPADIALTRNAGFDRHLAKPVRDADLQAVIAGAAYRR